MGGSRWCIETEFETEKNNVGLVEYGVRTWADRHHHITMCLLAGAFLWTLQQDWEKRCLRSPGPRCTEYSVSFCRKFRGSFMTFRFTCNVPCDYPANHMGSRCSEPRKPKHPKIKIEEPRDTN